MKVEKKCARFIAYFHGVELFQIPTKHVAFLHDLNCQYCVTFD